MLDGAATATGAMVRSASVGRRVELLAIGAGSDSDCGLAQARKNTRCTPTPGTSTRCNEGTEN